MATVEDIDDDDDDDDLPAGVYHDDDLPTVVCRDCGQEYLEDAPQCPACGHAVSREEDAATPRSNFFWVMMAITLLALILSYGVIF